MTRPLQDPRSGAATKTRARPRLQTPSLWKVILHNDDYTTQEFVVWILETVFRKPEAEAVRIMLDVHKRGKGIAGIYPYDIADTKVAQVKAAAEQQEFPLLCTLEPEG
ncbi:MAG TPA: ATP-dependent Clp protease adaptor ClpS [Holophaga sp.]|nr:ATP-dependent Clp protease adaptor ClpS [Holophaga sp.]HPS67119.1 ATP-dependent Clp protease adaptor ClpS [Holophaga sp.]